MPGPGPEQARRYDWTADWDGTESGLPTIETLTASDTVSSAEVASAALAQMGEDVVPGYAGHRHRPRVGEEPLPEVGGLADHLGLRDG
jgi:hypothetical protein